MQVFSASFSLSRNTCRLPRSFKEDFIPRKWKEEKDKHEEDEEQKDEEEEA